MLDFGAVAPEINSGRLYSGPGPGPMLAAAAAWDGLAAQLSAVATGYGLVLSDLADGWRGPASLSMTQAVAPYVAWLHTTAAAAEQAATQAKSAAAAYELAFAMTVPPPVIAANRILLLALVATNFFGQNTPAIAATEAHYAAMWIQDATAMYGYAGASAAACLLAPFSHPRPTTTPAGPAAQYNAVVHVAGNSVAAQASTQSPTWVDYLEHVPNVVNSVISNSSASVSARGIFITNARLAFQEVQEAGPASGFGGFLVSAVPARLSGPTASAVSAGMGRAPLVGSLSVPPGWAVAAPEIQPAALSQPISGTGALAATASDMAPVPGSAFSPSALGTLSSQGFDEPRPKSKPVIVRSPAAE